MTETKIVERPSLVQADNKPDVLVRLVEWHRLTFRPVVLSNEDWAALHNDIADGMDAISGLRAANQRHCDDERLLKDARARVAELEADLAALRSAGMEGR